MKGKGIPRIVKRDQQNCKKKTNKKQNQNKPPQLEKKSTGTYVTFT